MNTVYVDQESFDAAVHFLMTYQPTSFKSFKTRDDAKQFILEQVSSIAKCPENTAWTSTGGLLTKIDEEDNVEFYVDPIRCYRRNEAVVSPVNYPKTNIVFV